MMLLLLLTITSLMKSKPLKMLGSLNSMPLGVDTVKIQPLPGKNQLPPLKVTLKSPKLMPPKILKSPKDLELKDIPLLNSSLPDKNLTLQLKNIMDPETQMIYKPGLKKELLYPNLLNSNNYQVKKIGTLIVSMLKELVSLYSYLLYTILLLNKETVIFHKLKKLLTT